MPKISVILPVYNGGLYLKDSIESILQQTYQDFELIIVDDCSTDNTENIATNYAATNKNIIYIRNRSNLKLPDALNKGFSHASGDYWTWTSCDNLYLPNALECLLAELEHEKQVGLTYASMQIINEKNERMGFITAGPAEDLIIRNVVGACFLYRAKLAKQIGLYNKNMFLCEDYEYWLRLAQITRLKPIATCLYQYRRHPENLSFNHEKEIIAKGITLQKSYYPYFVKTRKDAARFYAALRAREMYNPWRQFYLSMVFFYSPTIFFHEIIGLIKRRFKTNEKN